MWSSAKRSYFHRANCAACGTAIAGERKPLLVGEDEYCRECFSNKRFRTHSVNSFAEILIRTENPMAAAMVLVLAWIASCDGEITEEELEGLRSIAASGKGETDLSAAIDIARRGQIQDLQLACEVLRVIEVKHRRLMLQTAIGMALEDRYLTTTEGHIIRFIADVLSQSPSDLDGLFIEMTGEAFPPVADPSSVQWWEAREQRSRTSNHSGNSSSQSAPPPRAASAPDMQRLRDFAALGLDEEATVDQVREAYRRMAKIHHPDRFVTLGPEAVRAAEVSFIRIQTAYERLVPT